MTISLVRKRLLEIENPTTTHAGNLLCGQNKYQSLELFNPVSCVRLHLFSLSHTSTRISPFLELSIPKFAFQSTPGSGKGGLLFLSIFTKSPRYRNPFATNKLPFCTRNMASITTSRIPASGLSAQGDTVSTHPYTCNTCQVAFRNSELQRGHMRSDWQ